jgi:hypothetical protein
MLDVVDVNNAKATALAIDPPGRSGRVKRSAVQDFPFVSSATGQSTMKLKSENTGVQLEELKSKEAKSDSSVERCIW